MAQLPTQTVRGKVVDKETQTALPGAAIRLMDDSSHVQGTTADVDGYFRFEKVNVGRRLLKVSFVGYQNQDLPNIIVTSGKEVVLSVELEALTQQMNEVVVQGYGKGEAMNEMATVSARTFSVEETGRYAGSRGDPARMAANFAGVQGSNDSRNDIVIRGNSPMGLLYRLDGVNIPNPNHFAIAGTTGGPVSIINNKTLARSDFFTGAFPAEYGNALAGVFDLNLRNGNNEKHELTAQLGFLGTELAAEGPISRKNHSSYLFAYRYSTLKLFQALKIQIGTSAVPNYQDLTFKLNFPTRKAGTFSVFGIGGTSKVDIVVSKNEDLQKEIYGDKDRDQYFRSSMGVVGVSHTYPVNASTFIRTTISASYSKSSGLDTLIFYRNDNSGQIDSLKPGLGFRFGEGKVSLTTSLTKKIGLQHTFKAGFIVDRLSYNFLDTVRRENPERFVNRFNYQGQAWLLQPYLQWRYKPTDQLTLTAGLNGLVFTLNNHSRALEPRLGLSYHFRPNQTFSLGYGLHHQIQPSYTYFYHLPLPDGNNVPHNREMGFTRSQHLVASYDYAFNSTLRFKVETYYQQLSHIPVTIRPSSFSLLNQGSTFSRFFPDSLTNTGTGRNYGVEFTMEKFFSKKYFLLFTASVFDSKYRGSDGILRNTDFNGRFATNLLSGAEWTVGKKKQTTLITGGKLTWSGGRRYGPADPDSSSAAHDVIYVDGERNSLQFPNYFRFDLRLGFRRNNRRVTHEVAVDLVNLLGIKNVLSISYAPNPKNAKESPLREEYQLGFLPLFYYKIDF